jgi:uncharacterized RDD family membrane protein YckC
MCLWCGYQVNPPAAASGLAPNEEFPLMEEQDISSVPAESAGEVPQWRQELSQRLLSIKQKREASRQTLEPESGVLPFADSAASAPPEQPSPMPAQSDPIVRPRSPVRETPRKQDQENTKPLHSSALPSEAIKPPEIEIPVDDTEPRDTKDLIDQMTSRPPTTPVIPSRTAGILQQLPYTSDEGEGRLILLSRTLSGLIDLIIMSLSAIILIIAADFFSGIITLDSLSIISYSVLFLLVYFLYSLFFIGISNQTVGMMITDLRVISGVDEKRPHMRQILVRCCIYLVSFLCLGIGLLWALFDSENRCFHDILTDTRVVRSYSAFSKPD